MLKIIAIILLLAIVASLFSALFFTFKKEGENNLKTVKALTLRVGLSVGLFIALLLAFRFGLIPGYQ